MHVNTRAIIERSTPDGIEIDDPDTCVECLQPFAVYQTIRGPVDSMGVYFRCRAEGQLLVPGDAPEGMPWLSVQRVTELLELDAHRVSWVDRAGLKFYLQKDADKPKRIPRVAREDEEREGCEEDRGHGVDG